MIIIISILALLIVLAIKQRHEIEKDDEKIKKQLNTFLDLIDDIKNKDV